MPKPLSFDDAPKKTENTSAPSGPKTLDFGSAPKSTPANPPPSIERAPKPLAFDETQPSPVAPPSPKPLAFSQNDKPRATVARTPAAPQPLEFVDNGSSKAQPPPPLRNFGETLFNNPLTSEELRAVEYARANFESLFVRNEMSITNSIRQLLPFKLDVVSGWGKTALENQGELVNQMAKITREFHSLKIGELLEEMLELPQKMLGGGLLARFTNRERTLAQHKLKAIGIQQHLNTLFPQVDALNQRFKKEGDRLPLLMVALASAASLETHPDTAIELCVQNRRTVLQQAVTQWQVIAPQLQSIREQLVDYQGKLEQMLSVTIPTIEMNLANSR